MNDEAPQTLEYVEEEEGVELPDWFEKLGDGPQHLFRSQMKLHEDVLLCKAALFILMRRFGVSQAEFNNEVVNLTSINVAATPEGETPGKDKKEESE